MTDREIARTSPPELANLPAAFWDEAVVVHPPAKQPISLRVDRDVLEYFKAQGPRYQSRMNAVLRSYVAAMRARDARVAERPEPYGDRSGGRRPGRRGPV